MAVSRTSAQRTVLLLCITAGLILLSPLATSRHLVDLRKLGKELQVWRSGGLLLGKTIGYFQEDSRTCGKAALMTHLATVSEGTPPPETILRTEQLPLSATLQHLESAALQVGFEARWEMHRSWEGTNGNFPPVTYTRDAHFVVLLGTCDHRLVPSGTLATENWFFHGKLSPGAGRVGYLHLRQSRTYLSAAPKARKSCCAADKYVERRSG